MKKLIIALFLFIVLACIIIYTFIPNPIIVNSVFSLSGSQAAVDRTIQKKQTWKKLWTKSSLTNSTFFTNSDSLFFENNTFIITKQFQNAFDCRIITDEDTAQTHFEIVSLPYDSIALNWGYSKPVSINPIKRMTQYYQAVAMKKNLDEALTSIKKYLTTENIYGLTVREISTTDTLLISTSQIKKEVPTTETIYNLIGILREYARKNSAIQTDSAIMNVTNLDGKNFKVMVAIPVDKRLQGTDAINFKLMIPGKFLSATVQGGNDEVNNAMSQMQQYFQDHQRTAMAIPFEKLLTNRLQEKDTSRWLTRLYFPVM